MIAPVVYAYAEVLHSVFLYAAPVGIVAFLLSLLLPQVPLRDAARAGAGRLILTHLASDYDPEESLAGAAGALRRAVVRRFSRAVAAPAPSRRVSCSW